MNNFVSLDFFADKNNISLDEALKRSIVEKDYAFIFLGSNDKNIYLRQDIIG